MTLTAREIMTGGAECAQVQESVVDVARRMRDLGVGSLPICGEDNQLKGVITDRDIVLHCVAEGADPQATTVEQFAGEKPVTIGADDSVTDALRTMSEHGVRRLPVIDGHDLIGVVSQADIARHLDEDDAGQLLRAISEAPTND